MCGVNLYNNYVNCIRESVQKASARADHIMLEARRAQASFLSGQSSTRSPAAPCSLHRQHESVLRAIMDSGNNKKHVFKTLNYFPEGVRYHTITITGVGGSRPTKVGMGTAVFSIVCVCGSVVHWRCENSLYNPTCPVNLLCADFFHYDRQDFPTGHEYSMAKQQLVLKCGKVVPVPRDPQSHLPLVHIKPTTTPSAQRDSTTMQKRATQLYKARNTTASTTSNNSNAGHTASSNNISSTVHMFKQTELQPLTARVLFRKLNCPNEIALNKTIQHNMIEGIEKVQPLRSINKADRPDGFWAGKMTRRHTPQQSRAPDRVKYTPGSHIVSDIGFVPVSDKSGNIYYVAFKDICTQYRRVYRMKDIKDLLGVWKRFLADHQLQGFSNNNSKSTSSISKRQVKFLVSDHDSKYLSAKMGEFNDHNYIASWSSPPYTHNQNPAEREMRSVVENAVGMLYDSGLGPSFLLDAIDCYCESANMTATSVYHLPEHQYKTPYERFHGTRPCVHDIARFGCKTFVFNSNEEREHKKDVRAWVGWYLGPAHRMRGCRVYRPVNNTIYERYHVYHDSGRVYGDFLGQQYRQRVETDQAQRRYYNIEVNQLLEVFDSTKSGSDIVLDLLRQLPWSAVPYA